VITGQRLMQFASDLFLGWGRSKDGHDFFIRQIADMKASIDVSTLDFKALRRYAALCGDVLAVGHARSGSAALIAGYLGRSNRFDGAVLSFVDTYTKQLEHDYARFLDGITRGDIPADGDVRSARNNPTSVSRSRPLNCRTFH
ncbi:MAG: DUF2252 family protein, partial [Candidatus Eremiobacteraeota bacterium]|nr:DUF2252 family protein [Candidatus Eremiobacteraeota bacterium]